VPPASKLDTPAMLDAVHASGAFLVEDDAFPDLALGADGPRPRFSQPASSSGLRRSHRSPDQPMPRQPERLERAMAIG
jgi:hypothetical protein